MHQYRNRNLIECFFAKFKQFRRVATCYNNHTSAAPQRAKASTSNPPWAAGSKQE
jgi:hypothetical protein